MVAVDFTDLECTFEMVSSHCGEDVNAFVDRVTGKVYCICDGSPDELPDDSEESDRYVPVPTRQDFDLGRHLVLTFVEAELPHDLDLVRAYFDRKGAYRNFKQLLESRGALATWGAFEQAATESALRQWCRENDLEPLDRRAPDPE